LQLMSLGAKAENRREEVSEMSRKLKALAMEVDVPIMALSQLNRVSTFEGAKVDISQLKETGSLEQDADMVWLMDWPKGDSGFGDQKTVEVKIAKNRNGPMGTAELIWVPQYQRYEE
jgi:replicative DNA helicase